MAHLQCTILLWSQRRLCKPIVDKDWSHGERGLSSELSLQNEPFPGNSPIIDLLFFSHHPLRDQAQLELYAR